jgi:hypothetical protein
MVSCNKWGDPGNYIPGKEGYKRRKAEEELGKELTDKEWDKYYEEYQRKHPPMELAWKNIKNRFFKKIINHDL